MFAWLRSKANRSRRTEEAAIERDPLAQLAAPAPPEPSGPVQLMRAGRSEEAEQASKAAQDVDPADTESLLVRGLLALDRGRTAEAFRTLEQAAKLAPESAELQTALGRACASLNRRPAARAAFQRAVELGPSSGEPMLQLALLALASGQKDEAASRLADAIRAEPGLAEAHFQLGNLIREQGRLDEAEAHYRRAVAADAKHAEAQGNLGSLLNDRGRPDEAARHLEESLRLKPDLAAVSFTLAMIRINQRSWQEAALLLRSSLASDPKQADANYWLGNAEMGLGNAAEARKAYQAAIRLDSNYLQARWGHVMAQIPAVSQADEEQSTASQQFVRELAKLRTWLRTQRPREAFRAVGAQQPYYLAYVPENHRSALTDYGTLCASLMASATSKQGAAARVRTIGSKHRIGIVSAHIHSHSVWHAILRGWVEHLDRASFDIQVFHTGSTRDAETEWATRRVARMHSGLGDWRAWASAISESALDVLVYPEIGMDTTTVRLASLRLAPTQLASWGHPITTGLPTMDGFVSAAAFEPDGAAAHYSEKLIALPRLGCFYRAYTTAADKPDLAAVGVQPTDRVLLCPGTPFKYAPRDDIVLVEIARRCRPCKIVFFRGQTDSLSSLLEARLRKAFASASLDFDEHVRFVPWQRQASFFGWLDRADVVLDSIGFSGFNTAMQAVERATPMVAWEAEFMRGRFASGILRATALDEWVASDSSGYVDRVARLCDDVSLRDAIRSRMVAARAGLFDDRDSVVQFGRVLTTSRG